MSLIQTQILIYLLYCLIIYYFRKYYIKGICYKSNRIDVAFVVIGIFCGVIGTQSGDYLHYIDFFEEISYGNKTQEMEQIYIWLISAVGGNYFLWRLCLYLAEYIILVLCLRTVGFNTTAFYFLYSVMCLYESTTGRYFWGLFLYFFGLILFYKEKRIYYLSMVILSFFAHKSIILLVAMAPLTLIKLNKKTILLIIATLPISVNFIQYITINFLTNSNSDYITLTASRYELYTDGLTFTSNYGFLGDSLGLLVKNLLAYISSFVFVVYSTYKIYFKKLEVDRYIHALITISIGLLVVVISYLFGETTGNTIAYRYLGLLKVPILLILYYFLFVINDKSKFNVFIAKMFFYYFHVSLLYEVYCSFYR